MGKFIEKNEEISEDEAIETQEWIDSLDHVIRSNGPQRVKRLLKQLHIHAKKSGIEAPYAANTPYINTIPVDKQPPFPGSREIERRIKSLIRWNAMAMVVRANRIEEGIGGHISTYASTATLFEIGFNHFFKAKTKEHEGDIVYLGLVKGLFRRASFHRTIRKL
jgi:pyruvate dehydrogenase E1 component